MNEEIYYADEDNRVPEIEKEEFWKVLIADDEQDVHDITKIILNTITFENKKIKCLNAYSGKEAVEICRQNQDIALILMDVVMENERAGLDAVKYIREQLKNNMVRIILRTGQPGQAPERTVIMNYSINDYKEKSELTAQKLYVTIITALRSYKELRIIEDRERQLIAANRKLFEAKELVEKESKVKSVFLGNISHELKTPLNGIMGMTELLQFSNPTKKQEEYLRHITTATERLLKIIKDLIEIASLDSGNVKLYEDKIIINELIGHLHEHFEYHLRKKMLDFRWFVSPEIPEAVLGDRIKTEKILSQITDNAIKFTEKGGVEINFTSYKKSDEDIIIEFAVRDTGIGIDEDKREKIFESFVQGDESLSKRHQGMGLGLAIAKKLVTLLGGEIFVESTKKFGSCFYFRLKYKY